MRMKTPAAFFLLLLSSVVGASSRNESSGLTRQISFIKVLGKTNLSEFSLQYASGKEDSDLNILIDGNRAKIPVRLLKAESEQMTRDFLLLLQEDRFPYIDIEFSENPAVPALEEADLLPTISLTIAGVENRYPLTCRLEFKDGKRILTGTVRLRLTDFNLQPPTKLMGVVKVQDEIRISFGVILSGRVPEAGYDDKH